jgi:hypothetical protein
VTGSLQLSQSGLAAFARCPRRFYLRFVRRLEWPAPLTGSEQEWERSLLRGEELHLFIQQAALGIDVQNLVGAMGDTQLATWWQNFVDSPPQQPHGDVHTELELIVPTGGVPAATQHQLMARFDRLIVSTDDSGAQIHIIDWKTGTPRDPSSLESSWQTVVYRYIAVEASTRLVDDGSPVPPDRVSFTYWQAEAPETPVVLAYDESAHEAARKQIEAAVGRIEQRLLDPLGEDAFERTTDLDACCHCPYRSYCERGREPPPGVDVEQDYEDSAQDLLAMEETTL